MDVVGGIKANEGGHESPDAEQAGLEGVDCGTGAEAVSMDDL